MIVEQQSPDNSSHSTPYNSLLSLPDKENDSLNPSLPHKDAATQMELDHRSPSSEFFKSTTLLNFEPINSSVNSSGNYSNYVAYALGGILKMSSLNFDLALKDPTLYENITSETERYLNSDKKILLLDLDETLVHADFEGEFPSSSYDANITFRGNDEQITVGIFIRNCLNEFLQEVSKEFEIGVFTASKKEYADSVLNYLDPQNIYFKFRLYRNNCINVNGASIKDLRIFKNSIKYENVVIVDNSMYSFANQLSNGILINSFFNDKTDNDLINVMSYLLTYIAHAKDVREINDQIFHFQEIFQQISNEYQKK